MSTSIYVYHPRRKYFGTDNVLTIPKVSVLPIHINVAKPILFLSVSLGNQETPPSSRKISKENTVLFPPYRYAWIKALRRVTIVEGVLGKGYLICSAMDQNSLVQLLTQLYMAFIWLVCSCLINLCISEKLVANKFIWVNISPYKKKTYSGIFFSQMKECHASVSGCASAFIDGCCQRGIQICKHPHLKSVLAMGEQKLKKFRCFHHLFK